MLIRFRMLMNLLEPLADVLLIKFMRPLINEAILPRSGKSLHPAKNVLALQERASRARGVQYKSVHAFQERSWFAWGVVPDERSWSVKIVLEIQERSYEVNQIWSTPKEGSSFARTFLMCLTIKSDL